MNEIVEDNFQHIRNLARDIEHTFENSTNADAMFRNEIAGMFAVTIAATYEGIVKETLISYAGKFHKKYKDHVENDLEQMNARVSIDNLEKYARHFGLRPWTSPDAKKNATTFNRILFEKRKVVERRFRKDPIVSYKNIFKWRHSYAHERQTSATFSDVYESHRVAQYVIRSFVSAFEIG